MNKNNKKVEIWNSTEKEDYFCPSCGSKLKRRLGTVNAHHFSHIKTTCDPWYKEKSEWHKNWQSIFPIDNREVIKISKESKHIADVGINDTVIEFQHSSITAKELSKRNQFYLRCSRKIIWVFDCYGKDIYMPSQSFGLLDNQIRAHTEIDTETIKKFYWYRSKRVLKNLIGVENIELFLHINDKYVIKIVECEDSWGFRNLIGKAYTIEEFLSHLAIYDKNLNGIKSHGILNGYSKKYQRVLDVKKLTAWIKEDNRNGNYSIKLSDDLRILFKDYIDGFITYKQMNKKAGLGYRRPTSETSYFYGLDN
nr:competence protein CoiA family protein [Haloplasma contractile]